MKLSSLEISSVRNLTSVKLCDLSNVNLFVGENGAGKSSILEAIHMLGLARSFRSTRLQPVITFGSDACTVFGRLERDGQTPISLGIQRPRSGGFKIKVGGERQKSVVSLAQQLPVQLINASSYQLLEGGPKQRRAFLDWGVFHVEQSFYHLWQRAQRSIKQRNAILRAGGAVAQLEPWDRELAEVGEQLHRYRSQYAASFLPHFSQLMSRLSDIDGLALDYVKGWDKEQSLLDSLSQGRDRDRASGFTRRGPHRADFRACVHGINAGDVLSRGQQKLVVSAMRLTQSEMLSRQSNKNSILLVDDLPSEIDAAHQHKMCDLLDQVPGQVFLTSITPGELQAFQWRKSGVPALFHMKHGAVVSG